MIVCGGGKLFKSFKTEINPTGEQMEKINKTIGTCRFIYNFYIAHNKELYENGEKFMTGRHFNVWLNNEYLPNNPDKMWIKDVYTKAVAKSMDNAYIAFKRFLVVKANSLDLRRKINLTLKCILLKTVKQIV